MAACLPKCQARQRTQGARAGPEFTSLWVSSQDLDCFIVDNNGFILISERPQEVRCWEVG